MRSLRLDGEIGRKFHDSFYYLVRGSLSFSGRIYFGRSRYWDSTEGLAREKIMYVVVLSYFR